MLVLGHFLSVDLNALAALLAAIGSLWMLFKGKQQNTKSKSKKKIEGTLHE